MIYTSRIFSPEHIRSAEEYFEEPYKRTIRKITYKQSLVARYEISRIVHKYCGIPIFLPEVDGLGKPLSENGIYWSISHSGDSVFVGVSDRPIGVDVEKIRSRDIYLFGTFSEQEWSLVGEKNWTHFYMLWSAKEALVKKYLEGIDEMQKWQLVRIEGLDSGKNDLFFSKDGRVEKIISEIMDDNIWSVSE